MKYQINEAVLGNQLLFMTTERCFSPRSIDKGTLAMLSQVMLSSGQKVLDLGCGYGVVGIACAMIVGQENVVMSDIDPVAVSLSKANAVNNHVPHVKIVESDGFALLEDTDFSIILCNPPYHADFRVAKTFIEKGFNRLQIGGKMLMVTKRREWYKEKFISIFGGIRICQINGYSVYEATKMQRQYAKSKKDVRNPL